MQPGANAVEADPQALGLAVASGQTESHVHAAVPALQQRGMLQFFPGVLFRIAPHHHDRLLWRFDAPCGWSRDCDLSVDRADWSHNGFAILQADVKGLL